MTATDTDKVLLKSVLIGNTGVASPAKRVNTGMPVIDELLGGISAGGVTGILGLTGGGKTTLALQTAVAVAKTTKKPVLYIMNDSLFDPYIPRLYSLTSGFPVKEIEAAGDNLAGLNSEKLKHLQARNSEIAGLFHPFNLMRRHKDESNAGGVEGIRFLIGEYSSKLGAEPAVIVIDQLLPLIYTEMEKRGVGYADMAPLINVVVDEIKELCGEYKVTGLLLHQRKESKEHTPDHVPAITEAQACSTWANALTNVLALGTLDDNHYCWLHAAKSRFTKSKPEIVKLNGAYARFEWEPETVTFQGRRFAKVEDEDAELDITEIL